MTTLKTKLGFVAIALSFLIWGLVFVMPFLGLPPADTALWMAGLYGISYAFFFLGTFALGKEAIQRLKQGIRDRWLPSKSPLSSKTSDSAGHENPT